MNASTNDIGLTDVIAHVKRWLDEFIIELNLCPFAKRERVNNTIRFVVTETHSPDQLVQELVNELDYLTRHADIETTLLIHPNVLTSFYDPEPAEHSVDCENSVSNGEPFDYNQFLNVVDSVIDACGYTGVYQVASFHPDYQFANTCPDDVENYTNRSPHPLLHILRERSVERAISRHPDPDGIPDTNIRKLNELGAQRIRAILATLATD